MFSRKLNSLTVEFQRPLFAMSAGAPAESMQPAALFPAKSLPAPVNKCISCVCVCGHNIFLADSDGCYFARGSCQN